MSSTKGLTVRGDLCVIGEPHTTADVKGEPLAQEEPSTSADDESKDGHFVAIFHRWLVVVHGPIGHADTTAYPEGSSEQHCEGQLGADPQHGFAAHGEVPCNLETGLDAVRRRVG